MHNFKLDFYKNVDGTKPVGEFIRNLNLKIKAKVVGDLHILEEYGGSVGAASDELS